MVLGTFFVSSIKYKYAQRKTTRPASGTMAQGLVWMKPDSHALDEAPVPELGGTLASIIPCTLAETATAGLTIMIVTH
jgi:hypothetical protein